jgi:hypothetical protein
VGQDGAGHVHRPEHVHLEVAADVRVVDGLEPAELGLRGVVHEHVDAAEPLDRLCSGSDGGVRIGHVKGRGVEPVSVGSQDAANRVD